MTLHSKICKIINTQPPFLQFLKDYSSLKHKKKPWLVRHWLKELIKNKQKNKKNKKGGRVLIILQIWERSVISPN
jgi:hypothetical protein